MHFWDDDVHERGITFQYQTFNKTLPLRARIHRMESDETKLAPQTYVPGQSIDLKISWTGSKDFLFIVDGRTHFTMKTNSPIAWFKLLGVGSRSVFDNNRLECDLIA